jgi:hypothetical protein
MSQGNMAISDMENVVVTEPLVWFLQVSSMSQGNMVSSDMENVVFTESKSGSGVSSVTSVKWLVDSGATRHMSKE